MFPAISHGPALCLNSSYFGFYAHAGFLAEAAKIGFRPAHLSGASAGALVAGLAAGGVDPEEIIGHVLRENLWKIFHEWSVPLRTVQMLFNRPGVTGAMRCHRAVSAMREVIGDRRIEDCTDPRLAIAVTNLTTGRSELKTAGPLADFIAASCSFPGVFAAHPVGGELYWDGGIANAVPISHWAGDPAVQSIVIHRVTNREVLAARQRRTNPGIQQACGLSHQVVGDEISRLQEQRVRDAGLEIIQLQTVTPRPGLLKRKMGPGLVELGRETARANAALLTSLMAGTPVRESTQR